MVKEMQNAMKFHYYAWKLSVSYYKNKSKDSCR